METVASTEDTTARAATLARDGRWFTYGGRHVYLVGLDMQSLAARTDLDRDGKPYYLRALDLLWQSRINKIRIWGNCFFMAPAHCLQPFAFENGKFDLDKWDDRYWERRKDFAREARKRQIIVEYVLFSFYQHAFDRPGTFWNMQNNRNGAFAQGVPSFFLIGKNGLPSYREQTNSGRDYCWYQLALVDKALAELGPFGNVYFEGFNEFPGDNRHGQKLWRRMYPWNQFMADYVHQKGYLYTAHITNVQDWESGFARPRGLDFYANRPSVDVLGLHTYQDDPNRIFQIWHDAQRKNKILQCNESFGIGNEWDKCTREMWGTFLAGGHYGAYYADRLFAHIGNEQWKRAALRLRALRDVAESVRFWEMSPVDGRGREYDALIARAPTGRRKQMFCNPGSEYVAYFWGNSQSKECRIHLTDGRFHYRWIDPRDGSKLGTGETNGGRNALIETPSPDNWSSESGLVLVIAATK